MDPDPEVLDLHASWLQEMDLPNHLLAENGPEAMVLINNFSPTLIIANMDIPVINGLSMLRLVRQNDLPEHATAFMLYGGPVTNRQLAQCGRLGASAIIIPPFGADAFKGKVNLTLYPVKTQEDIEADSLYELCQEQINRGLLEEALATCQKILSLHSSAEAYYQMGYIKSLTGDLDAALECFQRATTINRHHALSLGQMGFICKKMGRDGEAQKYLAAAADIHMDLQQDKEAEEIFNTILSINPETTNVYNSLGIIYRRQSRLDESLKAYAKALKIHPLDEYIFFNLARTHLDMGNRELARQCLRKSLEIDPNFTPGSELLRATDLGLEITI